KFLAAKCYLATNQTGSAKAALQDIVDKFKDYDPARILLTQILLKEYRFDEAEKNLAILESHIPDSMDVIRMRIAVLQQQKKSEEAKALYQKLPEDTRNRQLDKAAIALLMSQDDEAKRLLQGILAKDAGDVDAALMLAGYYARTKDTAAALAAIDSALKVKPN